MLQIALKLSTTASLSQQKKNFLIHFTQNFFYLLCISADYNMNQYSVELKTEIKYNCFTFDAKISDHSNFSVKQLLRKTITSFTLQAIWSFCYSYKDGF